MPYDDLSTSAPTNQPPPVGDTNSQQTDIGVAGDYTGPKTPQKSDSVTFDLSNVPHQDGHSTGGSDPEHYNYLRADLTPSHITDGASRQSSVKARAIITNALAGTDADEDNVPRRKRASADDVGEQDRASSKRPRKNLVIDFDRIGCHKVEPQLLIRAKSTATGLKVSVFEEDVPLELAHCWKLVNNNGYVNLDDVDLDPQLFPVYANSADMTKEKKSELIKKYLQSLGRDFKTTNKEPESLNPLALGRSKAKNGPRLHVGVQKTAQNVQVYGYLAFHTDNLLFHKDIPEHIRKAEGYSIAPESIDFKPEIDQGDLVETKSFIKKKLKELRFSDTKTGGQRALTDHTKEFKMSLNRARQAQKDCANSFELILEEMERQSSIHEEETSALRSVITRQAENEVTKSHFESEIENLQDALSKAKMQVQTLEGKLNDRNQDVDNLQLQLKYYEQADLTRKGGKEAGSLQAITPTDLNLSGIIYTKIPSGPNTGKYVEENSRIVYCDGKIYDEYKVVHKLDLDIAGGKKDKQIEMGGMSFACFDEYGTEKCVSMIGPHSVVVYEGQQFVEWTVRKEVIKKVNYRI